MRSLATSLATSLACVRPVALAAALTVFAVTVAGCGGSGGSGDDTSDPASPLAAKVDAFMVDYLAAQGITATTLTVMKDGEVLYEKAYGYHDAAATVPLEADALMTGASIVKPVTAAAVQKLASDGRLALDDKVFCSGSTTPSADHHCWIPSSWVASTDTRIFDITVAHLMSHQAGWNRAGTACYAYQQSPAEIQAVLAAGRSPCDPIQHEFIVQLGLGLSAPPTLAQDVQFFLRGDLDYTPGEAPDSGVDRYSNMGYLLLGHIVEAASGSGYNDYVNGEILAPLGVAAADFQTAHSRLADADPREPNYLTTKQSYSVYEPGKLVSARDGVLVAANHQAAATTMMTSRAMASFAGAYRIGTDADGIDGVDNGKPLATGETHTAYHRGDLPGTAAVLRQRVSGVSYAVLMNRNDRYEGDGTRVDYPADVMEGLDAVLSAAGY